MTVSIAEEAFRVEAIPNGTPDLQVRDGAGGWCSVHDTTDPRREARALIDQNLKGRPVPAIVAVIGVGLGHIVEELEATRPDVRIVAVEIVPGLLAACRRHSDWSTRDRQGRLVFAGDPSQPLASPAWPHRAIAEKPLAIVNPVLARHFPTEYESALGVVKQFFYEQRANAEARRRLAGTYLCHTIENLPVLASAPDVSALDGIAKGEPVVLIGAGPSLDRLLPQLAANRQRAWYVALDTALKPLLRAGVVPDLVISVDPTTLNGRHLINLPTRARPYLVAEMSVDPRACATFSGRTFAARIGNADPWPWFNTLGVDATWLQVWGSVLTASCDLLTRMGAGLCLFAGMDLAYTNNQPYCRGTSFEDDWQDQLTRDGLASLEDVWETRIAAVAVPDCDVEGRTVRTAPQMVAFRNWVRANVSAGGRQVVNVTGAGILHGTNIGQSTLDDALRHAPALTKSIETRLAAAALRRKRQSAPAAPLAQAVHGALAARDDEGMWATWNDAIPDFDPRAVRAALRQAGSRLQRSHGRTARMGAMETDWIDVPYDAGNFTAKAPLSWQVRDTDIMTYAYRVQNKTMTLAFKINHSVLAGAPANEIYINIPGNYLPHRSMANPVWLRNMTSRTFGYATVHPGCNYVVVLRASEEIFPVEPHAFFVFGQLTFEVQ